MEKQDTASSEETQSASTHRCRGRKARCLLVAILLILALSLAGAALWLFWQQSQQIAAQEETLHRLQQTAVVTSQLRNDQQSQQQALDALQDSLEQTRDELAEIAARDAIDDKALRMRWTLAEIEHLLDLANQRALLARDTKGARQALQLADEQIRELGDYRLQPLREQIADEMLALDSVAKLDTGGMAADLRSALKSVNQLRVVKGPRQQAENATTDAGSSDLGSVAGWQNAAGNIWEQIRSLVVIRHQEDASAAVLVPEQRYFLYQNLRLQLETARYALLSGNNALFSDSIAMAVDWLNTYFVGDKRDAMLALLDDLDDEDVDVSIPDISGSLRWIQDFEP